jgi:L-cysteine S-thiosulfotransferase
VFRDAFFLKVLVAIALVALAGCALGPEAVHEKKASDVRRSGYTFMSAATQAMQNNDAENPGMLWVAEGEAAFQRAEGAASKSCASCHGDAGKAMRGVAARYPAYDEASKQPINLAQRINQCRQNNQRAEPLAYESAALLNLEAYVTHQSRGVAIAPPNDARLQPYRERGRARYVQKMGQLDLSCAQCHDDNPGKRLAGNVIPQAHPTGYPIYRLEWQGVGSLHRRLRNCMSGVRAEVYPLGAPELVELELYLATRAAGMMIEAPGVRP